MICQISHRQHETELGYETKQFSSKVKTHFLCIKLENQSDRGKHSFQYNYSKRKGIQIK